jgi:hypothetical protein
MIRMSFRMAFELDLWLAKAAGFTLALIFIEVLDPG